MGDEGPKCKGRSLTQNWDKAKHDLVIRPKLSLFGVGRLGHSGGEKEKERREEEEGRRKKRRRRKPRFGTLVFASPMYGFVGKETILTLSLSTFGLGKP